jgi:flagellar L-ring protein precursor FlgH
MNYLLLGSALVLSACAGAPSQFEPENIKRAEFRSAPMPQYNPLPELRRSADVYKTSLWSNSPKSLFGDRRAKELGDLVTVVIEIDEEAEMQNSVDTDRSTNQSFGVGGFFGLPQLLDDVLPDGASSASAVDLTRTSNLQGAGNIRRNEKLTLRLAAQIADELPNGYLYLEGRQEILVNNEARHLMVSGIIRTEDITRLNTITYDKIANAQIYYGGRGDLSNSVKTRLGSKIVNRIIPF